MIFEIALLRMCSLCFLIRAYLFDDLLSDDECEKLIQVHKERIAYMSHVDPLICMPPDALKEHLEVLGQSQARISRHTFIAGNNIYVYRRGMTFY